MNEGPRGPRSLVLAVSTAVAWTIAIGVLLIWTDLAVRGDMLLLLTAIFTPLAVFFYWRGWQR